MQAIQTSFKSCTNTKPDRIKAECSAGKIIVPLDYSLDVEYNHTRACHFLMAKLNWSYSIKSGQLKDGSYCHVMLPWGA